jgi:putative tryptophan/tyrosine transport system substrate-binding protein
MDSIRVAAEPLGVHSEPIEVRVSQDLEAAFETTDLSRADAVASVGIGNTVLQRLPELALQRRLPGIVSLQSLVKLGMLMSYSPNIPGMYRRAGAIVDMILKGAKPADLPVQQPYHLRPRRQREYPPRTGTDHPALGATPGHRMDLVGL